MIDLTLGHYSERISKSSPRAVRPSSEYGNGYGIPQLRDAIADLNLVARENVAIVSGASAGLLSTLLSDGRPSTLVVPRPYYPGYRGLAETLDIKLEMYSVTEGAIGLSNRLREPRGSGRAVAIWNSPHNPTGRLETDQDRMLLREISSSGTQLIEDRAYDEIVAPSETIRAVVDGQRHVLVGSFSKSLAIAGERVGYLIADRATIDRAVACGWKLLMSPPLVSQQVALQHLLDPSAGERNEDRRAHRQTARRHAAELFGSLVDASPDAPYFLWLDFTTSRHTSDRIAEVCLTYGVLVSSGSQFGASGPAIRISLVSVQMSDLLTGLELVRAALDDLGLMSDRI